MILVLMAIWVKVNLMYATSLFSSLVAVEGFPWQARLWKSKGGELGRHWASEFPRMGETRTFDEYCMACSPNS